MYKWMTLARECSVVCYPGGVGKGKIEVGPCWEGERGVEGWVAWLQDLCSGALITTLRNFLPIFYQYSSFIKTPPFPARLSLYLMSTLIPHLTLSYYKSVCLLFQPSLILLSLLPFWFTISINKPLYSSNANCYPRFRILLNVSRYMESKNVI